MNIAFLEYEVLCYPSGSCKGWGVHQASSEEGNASSESHHSRVSGVCVTEGQTKDIPGLEY